MRLGGPLQLLNATVRPILVRPTNAAYAAAGQAPASGIPPSFLQVDHLRAAAIDPTTAGSAQLGVAARISGDLDLDALTAAVTDFVRAHDGLRTWFAPVDGGFHRHIVPRDQVDFEATLLPGPTDTAWTPALIEHFARTLSPFVWPPIGFAALPGDGGFDVVFVADHAVSDGISQASAARELADRYDAHRAGVVSSWPATNPGSAAAYAAEEYARAEARADELSPHWFRALAETGFRLPSPGPEHPEIAEGQRYPRHFHNEVLLEPELARRFDAVLAAAEIRPSTALFAALALTDYARTGQQRYTALNVVATRGKAYATAQGWLCNFVPVTFELSDEPDFASTVAAARGGLDRCRTLAALPAHAALARLLATGQGSEIVTREPGFVTLLDAGPGQDSVADIRIFSGEGLTSTVSSWLVRTDKYSISLGAPDIPAVRARLADYTQALRHTLTSIAVTGEISTRRGRAA